MKKDLLYLKKLFSKPFRAVRAGGQTNRNYVVTLMEPFDPSARLRAGKLRARKFFVRLPWESKVLDRTIEGENILALSRNKKVQRILPKYYIYVLSKKNILNLKDKNTYSVPDGTMVAEFLEGKEFSMRHFKKKRYQKILAKTLAIFHRSGVRFVNPYNVFRDEIQKYRIEASKHQLGGLFDEDTVKKLRAVEKKANREIVPVAGGISTHNDFLFQNLILGKKNHLYLLDFEYAGLNKKGGILYDIGYIFVDHLFRTPPMTKSLFDEFLRIVDKTYTKKVNREQVYWSAIAAILVQIWWGAMRYFSVSKKEQPYFRAYTQKRIQGVSQLTNILKEKGARKS